MASHLARASIYCLSLSACLELDRSDSDPPRVRDAGQEPPASLDGGGASEQARYVHGECWIGLRGAELVARAGETLDTCVANFAGPACSYRVEYGQGVADPFAERGGDEVELVDIAEGSARVITVPDRLNSDSYLIGLYVASFPSDGRTMR
jgi:hypothetical protein